MLTNLPTEIILVLLLIVLAILLTVKQKHELDDINLLSKRKVMMIITFITLGFTLSIFLEAVLQT